MRTILLLIYALVGIVAGFSRLAGQSNAQERTYLTNTRQLIFEGKRSGEGYFSKDGQTIIFQSEREPDNPFYQIYTLNLTNGEVLRVSPGVGKTTCGFINPVNGKLMFSSTHEDTATGRLMQEELDFRKSGKKRRYAWDYDPAMEIYQADPNGQNLRNLTNSPGYDAEGSYSPDGKQIVFCSFRHVYPLPAVGSVARQQFDADPAFYGEIYIMNADGSNVRRLTNWPGYDGGPFFTPDGQRIVFRHFSEDGTTADVFTIKTDGTDLRRLTNFKAMSWAPYFHPSGKYCIFTANKQGFDNFELYIVDSEGQKEPVRITYTSGFDGLPVFHPLGNKLLWTSTRTADGKAQLFYADWDHFAALAALSQAPDRQDADPILPPIPDASVNPAITTEDLREKVTFLASDQLAGRMTGSNGSLTAAAYIAKHLEKIGFKPFGENYFQSFEFDYKNKEGQSIVKGTDRNVIAYLPPAPGAVNEEYVVLGAHFDHIGTGLVGSLAKAGEEGQIHNGADDNASGVSLVLELAAYFAQKRATNPESFRRGLVVAFFSGEELGLLGSAHFVKNAPLPLNQMVAYLNFDMVGRLRENKLIIQGSGSSDYWPKVIEKYNITAGFSLSLNPDPYLPTDATSFYLKQVPILSFFSGAHEDYHHPHDDADKLNYEGIVRIGSFIVRMVEDLLKSTDKPNYLKVAETKPTTMRNTAIYLGTIPDYTGGEVGLKLSGVKPGGPAEKAGLQGGDVVVNLGGKPVTNIYDYMAAMDGLTPGKKTTIVIKRAGKTLKLKIIPKTK